MNYKIIDNFLERELFLKLKNQVEDIEFPWRRRFFSSPGCKTDKGYFTHSVYSDFKMSINSPLYEAIVIPVLYKLKAKAVIQARINMFINEFLFEKYLTYHRDYTFDCKTAILNITNCNGGTQLKINNDEITIESKENRVLIFDTVIEHRTIRPSNSSIRHILNINYF
tara:strand:+ start:294 stop:797 length:504 start_codon:yes stop_codon:yes gene_type:complete